MARSCNLDRDVTLPEGDEAAKALSMDERDGVVGQVYRKLMEIESRLLPCGLHVVGCAPSAMEAVATLVSCTCCLGGGGVPALRPARRRKWARGRRKPRFEVRCSVMTDQHRPSYLRA